MLEALKNVMVTAAVMAVACTMLEFILPKGKLKTTVTIAAGLIFLLSIAGPIISLLGGGADISFSLPHEEKAAERPMDYEAWLSGLYAQSALEPFTS